MCTRSFCVQARSRKHNSWGFASARFAQLVLNRSQPFKIWMSLNLPTTISLLCAIPIYPKFTVVYVVLNKVIATDLLCSPSGKPLQLVTSHCLKKSFTNYLLLSMQQARPMVLWRASGPEDLWSRTGSSHLAKCEYLFFFKKSFYIWR